MSEKGDKVEGDGSKETGEEQQKTPPVVRSVLQTMETMPAVGAAAAAAASAQDDVTGEQ